MKLPKGTFTGEQLDEILEQYIEHNKSVFYTTISQYDPMQLYSHWQSIVRSIDEIINIQFELQDINEKKNFLELNFNFFDDENVSKLKIVIDTIEKRFEKKVADRLFAFVFMCKAVDASNNDLSVVNQKGMELNLSNTANLIAYLQSRRAYYLATL